MDGAASTLTELLRERYPELSRLQRRVADRIMQSPGEVQFLSSSEMAHSVNVSESALTRFAQLIGFGGYPDLRNEVRREYRLRATQNSIVELGADAVANEHDLISVIASRDIAAIHDTIRNVDASALNRCADRMVAAKNIYFVGHRASFALAEYFAVTLRQGLGVGTPLAFGTGMVYEFIASSSPEDVVVAIGITPYAQQTIDILRAAEDQGLFRIVLTDHPLGYPARLADEVIVFETQLHAFTSSYVGVMSVIHLLMAMISQKTESRHKDYVRRTNQMHDRFATQFHE